MLAIYDLTSFKDRHRYTEPVYSGDHKEGLAHGDQKEGGTRIHGDIGHISP